MSPVSFAIFASAAGPISSLSCKQKMKLRHPGLTSFLCEPTCFLKVQPIRISAA